MSYLFSPLRIKGLTLKNRIAISPMCQYSADDGMPNDWHLVHLGSRAVGGAGLIMVEATAVSPEGRITPGDLGIWDDAHVAAFKRITQFITLNGAMAGIQIAHAGRKASHNLPWMGGAQLSTDKGGWETVAPSSIAFAPGETAPSELDVSGIEKVKSDFKAAAQRALKAGFKVLEIHAAHGYLLFEFLSPLSNRRTDTYGGSFQNRIRLLLEIVESVKTVWSDDLPLFVRVSSTDWVEGGWCLDDTVKLARVLKSVGVDLLDCSSGGNTPDAKIPVSAGFQVPFAEAVKKTGILSAAVGLISAAQQAEDILASGSADLIFLGREALRNPYFPLNAAKILEDDVLWPVQYERAKL